MESWLFWTLIVMQIAGLMASAYLIGKPREAMTGRHFAVNLAISSAIIVALFLAGNPS